MEKTTMVKDILKKIVLYAGLVTSGVVADQVLTAQKLNQLEERLQQKIQQKATLGRFELAEMYRGPDKNQFYIIRLGANPNDVVDVGNVEIYLNSLRETYFPSYLKKKENGEQQK